MIKSTDVENSANVAQILGRYLNWDEELKNDELLSGFVNAPDNKLRGEIKNKVALHFQANNLNSAKTRGNNGDLA